MNNNDDFNIQDDMYDGVDIEEDYTFDEEEEDLDDEELENEEE